MLPTHVFLVMMHSDWLFVKLRLSIRALRFISCVCIPVLILSRDVVIKLAGMFRLISPHVLFSEELSLIRA